MSSLIAFDDTGSPGKTVNSRFLDSERKTYVGVIFESYLIDEVSREMNNALTLFRDMFGTTECHLTDIMNAQGEWAHVCNDKRLGIFKGFCEIFSHYNFTCIVQTWAPSYYARNNMEHFKSLKHGQLKLSDHKDMAMFMALSRTRRYLLENNYKVPVSIVFDEGRRKAGSSMQIPILNDITNNSSISFMRSDKNLFLQIADFAAYCLNKSQLLAVKGNRTETDDTILTYIDLANFNYQGVQKIQVGLDDLDSEHYDYIQRLYLDKVRPDR